MKTKYELETIEIFKVKLDIYFTYDDYFGFTIQSIEDITGTQDLYPIINDYYINLITVKLHDLYEERGLLNADTM